MAEGLKRGRKEKKGEGKKACEEGKLDVGM